MMIPHRGAGAVHSGATWSPARRLVIISEGKCLGRLFKIAGRTASVRTLHLCIRIGRDFRERRGVAVGMCGELGVRYEVLLREHVRCAVDGLDV